MSEEFRQIDKDTLEITDTPDIIVTREYRADIQTQIDHWEQDLVSIQISIDDAKAKIAILDA